MRPPNPADRARIQGRSLVCAKTIRAAYEDPRRVTSASLARIVDACAALGIPAPVPVDAAPALAPVAPSSLPHS
jgi:hypothetical protein